MEVLLFVFIILAVVAVLAYLSHVPFTVKMFCNECYSAEIPRGNAKKDSPKCRCCFSHRLLPVDSPRALYCKNLMQNAQDERTYYDQNKVVHLDEIEEV